MSVDEKKLAMSVLLIEAWFIDAIQGHSISLAGCPDKMTKDKARLAIRNYQNQRDQLLSIDVLTLARRILND